MPSAQISKTKLKPILVDPTTHSMVKDVKSKRRGLIGDIGISLIRSSVKRNHPEIYKKYEDKIKF